MPQNGPFFRSFSSNRAHYSPQTIKNIASPWNIFASTRYCQTASESGVDAILVDKIKIDVNAKPGPPGQSDPPTAGLDLVQHAKRFGQQVFAEQVRSDHQAPCTAAQYDAAHDSCENGAPQFLSNQAGGILGGISTGQPVVARFAVKPTSSILTPRKTVTTAGEETDIVTKGRHDPCVGIRAVPVGEAMMAIVLADHYLRHRGQNG